jgi:hypothetical protein
MSIVKELVDERFQERIDKTINVAGKHMIQILVLQGLPLVLRDDLEKHLLAKLDDHFNHVATHEEREELLNEHEELPF